MAEHLMISIGVGLVVSLLFSEFFGLAAGGLVVPGYFALFLHKPGVVVATVAAGVGTFLVVRLISNIVIVYGRRRTVLMVLIGYIIGILIRTMLPALFPDQSESAELIGYIIPGLIGIWLDRQGVIETLATLVTAAVVVRLALILVLGTELAR